MRKEWIIRLLKTLTKAEYEQVLRNAKSEGFKIDGFKDVTKVPLARLVATLNCNNNNMKKHLTQLVCITNAIIAQCEYILEKDEENSQAELRDKIARSALHKGTDKDESINKMLDELEHSIEQGKKKQNEEPVKKPAVKEESYQQQFVVETEDTSKRVKELNKHVAELTEALEKAKAKTKKQDEKIVSLNMDNEDKDKTIKRLEKELNHARVCEEREDELIALQEAFTKLQTEQKSLIGQMKEKDAELVRMNEQLDLYQDENSKKVLMFSKKELAANHFPGYRIHNVTSFGIDHRIPWEDFDEIWVISRDFDYGTIREIKRASQRTVHTFYSHKVITTV
ncbi:MAG: hypothetical protein Q4G58_11265 [bacterium]|nr:hypothetical protein [bacterium]